MRKLTHFITIFVALTGCRTIPSSGVSDDENAPKHVRSDFDWAEGYAGGTGATGPADQILFSQRPTRYVRKAVSKRCCKDLPSRKQLARALELCRER